MTARCDAPPRVDAARSGAVQPVIAGRFALEDIAEAQAEFKRSRHVGKIVLTVT